MKEIGHAITRGVLLGSIKISRYRVPGCLPEVGVRNPGENRLSNGFQQILTEPLADADRFDYWKSVFSRMDLRLSGKRFSANALLCADTNGTVFGYSVNDGVVHGRTRGDTDFIMIGATLNGTTRVRRAHDEPVAMTSANGIGIFDSSLPLTTLSEDHAHTYIALPRALVVEQLEDGDISFLQDGLLALPQVGLRRSLHHHLRMMALDASELDESAVQFSLQIATELALGILACEQSTRRPTPPRDHTHELYTRALRYIHQHHDDPALVASTIAYHLGCSRAHLYRAFSQRGECVGAAIRAVRILNATKLLKAKPAMPLSRIAVLCGYATVNGLSRAFIRETGMAPSRYRSDPLSIEDGYPASLAC